ncbi:hypothetical protein GF325_11755, partial [Candidatus Bathyarchaeota archaeon]|nr:hypothetical protein [Candidatus Bathyarchaeota archaeon]
MDHFLLTLSPFVLEKGVFSGAINWKKRLDNLNLDDRFDRLRELALTCTKETLEGFEDEIKTYKTIDEFRDWPVSIEDKEVYDWIFYPL